MADNIPDDAQAITDAPETHPTKAEIKADNLNLALARAMGLDPRLVKQPGFTITTDGSGMVEVAWEGVAALSMEFFTEIVSSVVPTPQRRTLGD